MMTEPEFIATETTNAEDWLCGVEDSQEKIVRLRLLCDVLMNAKFKKLQNAHIIGMLKTMDEMLWEIESNQNDLVRFFGGIDRIGHDSITCKPRPEPTLESESEPVQLKEVQS